MKHYFFNLENDLLETSIYIFEMLGIKKERMLEGDSSHVLGGIYYEYSVFGVEIKIELNSYDYDDKYRYMLTVKEDFLSTAEPDQMTIDSVANVVGRCLSKFLKQGLMYEDDNDELKPFIST